MNERGCLSHEFRITKHSRIASQEAPPLPQIQVIKENNLLCFQVLCAENADKESVGKECLFNKDKEQHNNNRGCDTNTLATSSATQEQAGKVNEISAQGSC